MSMRVDSKTLRGAPLACPDWWQRLQDGRTPIPDLELDEPRAEKAVAVFNRLRLPDVPGQPFMAEAAGDWMRDLLRAIFGSVECDDAGAITGRSIRTFFELVPKKNAKTTSGAAIMLVALLLNQRPRADFLLVGPTQETADLAFNQAAGMIEADDSGFLQKRFHIRHHNKEIIDRTNKARLSIKSFDNQVMTGQKPVGVLIDELHELGKKSFAERVLAQIRGGILANPEGFLIYITTQSDEPPTGVFKSELEYARGVRDGRIVDADMLACLYEFPLELQAGEEQSWRDRRLWELVLPNAGRSISVDRLDRLYREAEEKGDEALQIFASQHLNVQIGIALHRDSWAGARYWAAAADETVTMDALLERCEVVTIGIDGGGLDDMLGFAACGRERDTKRRLFAFRAWVQPDVLERRKEIADRLRGFHRDGHLTICAESMQDVMELAELVEKFWLAGLLPEKWGIGLDPVGVSLIIDELTARGIPDEVLTPVAQGYRLSGSIKGMERWLKDGRAAHDGSPLMVWCVGNAKVEVRGSAVLITKEKAGTAKIDPLVAGFNANALMDRNPVAGNGNPVSPWDRDETYRLVA